MDTFNVHNVQNVAYPRQHLRLPDVPAPAFTPINDLLNLCPDLETLTSWIETVHRYKQTATRKLLHSDIEGPISRRSRSSKKSIITATGTLEGRYKCYKCHKRVGTSKEFRRHMEEKCELLRLHHCPDCVKTYRRGYHLSDHHKKDHGCIQGSCSHLIDAAQYVPPKSVLGCGYCIQPFDKAKDFINHLVKHLEARGDEPTWSDTTHVKSLLQHPRIRTTWNSLCATRFDGPAYYWPRLTWNINEVEEEVHDLQYGISGQDLSSRLAKVLEKGIRSEHIDQKPGLLTTSVSLPNYDFQNVTTTHDFFEDPPLPLTAGLGTHMNNGLPNDCFGFADLTNTTPSTLVNTEDFWAANAPSSGYADDMMMSDFKESLPTFDASLDCTTDFMDLVAWEADTYDERPHTNTHRYAPTLTPVSPPRTQVDNVERMVMSSIPGFYQDAGSATEHHTTPVTGIVAPMDTISSPSLEDQYIGSLSSEPLPPFNPTPPLQGQRSHKRSISGRFLRMIQNMPNIPPTF